MTWRRERSSVESDRSDDYDVKMKRSKTLLTFSYLSCDAFIILKSGQYELLDVLDDLSLAEVVNADPPEAREVSGDGGGLSGGEDWQQPPGKQVGVTREELGDVLTGLAWAGSVSNIY